MKIRASLIYRAFFKYSFAKLRIVFIRIEIKKHYESLLFV